MMNDKRLLEVARMLPDYVEIASDIGTDHGKLGAYLLETGRCGQMWFSDISVPSLEKARILAAEKGFGDRASCYAGDGAKPLPGCPDAAVIAGMGGNTISDILRGGIDKLRNAFLVLQPNTHVYETRQTLQELGFTITDECIAEEAGRLYTVIAAKPGKAEYTYEQLLAGPVLISDRSEKARAYALRQLKLAQTALEARKAAGADTQQAQREAEVWQNLL